MKTFEIHITGDASIHDKAKILGIKTIEIVSLRPDGSTIETLHMTSTQECFLNYEDCLERTKELSSVLEAHGVKLTRVKIEAPPLKEYYEHSLYIEAHFKDDSFKYPTSFNLRSRTCSYLGTDRTYDKTQYESFREKWFGKEVELCLYDTNITQDYIWMNLYEKN